MDLETKVTPKRQRQLDQQRQEQARQRQLEQQRQQQLQQRSQPPAAIESELPQNPTQDSLLLR